MDNEQENKDILKMMVDNETAISEIYRIYAQRYKKQEKFWNDLAREEIQHARLIEKLSKSKDVSISNIKERFTPEVFKISFRYLEEKREQAAKETLSFKEALSIALDIETGMLERGYLSVFQGDSPKFQMMLETLDMATQEHCNKIRKLLAHKKWFFF